jgi:hypothetical protein
MRRRRWRRTTWNILRRRRNRRGSRYLEYEYLHTYI